MRGHVEAIEWLLREGVNPHQKNVMGMSAADIGRKYGHSTFDDYVNPKGEQRRLRQEWMMKERTLNKSLQLAGEEYSKLEDALEAEKRRCRETLSSYEIEIRHLKVCFNQNVSMPCYTLSRLFSGRIHFTTI